MLTTPRLRLRLLGPENAPEVRDYHLRNRDYFATAGPRVDDDYFTEDYQRNRLLRELEMAEEGNLVRLWIFPRSDDSSMNPIGDISMSHIIRGIMHSCFLGYKIDCEHAGKGYMTEALERVVGFAFDNLGLHRVEANIMPTNLASQRVVEKLGFVREGYSRQYLRINGSWADHLRYTRLNDAWTEGVHSSNLREKLTR